MVVIFRIITINDYVKLIKNIFSLLSLLDSPLYIRWRSKGKGYPWECCVQQQKEEMRYGCDERKNNRPLSSGGEGMWYIRLSTSPLQTALYFAMSLAVKRLLSLATRQIYRCVFEMGCNCVIINLANISSTYSNDLIVMMWRMIIIFVSLSSFGRLRL